MTPVLPEHLGTFADLDPTAPGRGGHMNFDMILRRCGHAWTAMLDEAGGFGRALIVPRIEVDYLAEVGEGELVVEVTVVSIGRTSFRLRMQVLQDGRKAAQTEAVLVLFDYQAATPVPLSPEQRSTLERLREDAPVPQALTRGGTA